MSLALLSTTLQYIVSVYVIISAQASCVLSTSVCMWGGVQNISLHAERCVAQHEKKLKDALKRKSYFPPYFFEFLTHF